MGYDLSLTTSDGHSLDAYAAEPEGTVRAGMVIIQEIFGVNDDIRETVLPALRHRLILNFEGEAEGIISDDILTQILDEVPRESVKTS